MKPGRRNTPRLLAVLLTWGYALALLGWLALRAGYGDTPWWLAILNTFSLYLFAPAVVLAPLVLWSRRRAALAGWLIPLSIFVSLYGEPFLPKLASASAGHSQTFSVMTFNVAGWSTEARPIVELIRAESPDVVVLQELNLLHAQGLETALADTYPFQGLHPVEGTSGLGVLSRLPMRDLGWVTLGRAPHAAQRVQLQVQDHTIELLNVHLEATYLTRPLGRMAALVRDTYREREEQAQQLVEFGRTLHTPVIIAGDLNTTDTTQTYAILRRQWSDAQRQAGWGWGLTFPAARDSLASLPIPFPLLRIDYVLYSDELAASEASVAPWEGQSDHRAFTATLGLK